MKKVCAFAPATIANLSVGFDVLGLALSSIGDKVELTENQEGKHQITEIISEANLPKDIMKNSCSAVIMEMQKATKQDFFVDIRIKKGFKAGSGLGSSAASSVAAAVAYNELLGNPFEKKELLKFAAEGERIACGSAIYDNTSASLFGGLILINERNIIKLPLPKDLYILAYFQKIEIRTKDARDLLPQNIPLEQTIQYAGNLASFVHALHTDNLELIKTVMKDNIAEPHRKMHIPNFEKFREISQDFDALAFGISGSGPTVFVLSDSKKKIENIHAEFNQITQDASFETIAIMESLNDNLKGAYVCEDF